MSAKQSALRFLRLLHLYFGVLIAPALLFFAFSGALQTFDLHTNARDGSYRPARWVLVLAQLHKHQRAQILQRPLAPAKAASEAAPATAGATAPQQQEKGGSGKTEKAQRARHPLPLRIFFVLVCLGLFSSVASGLYMTYRFARSRRLVTATLVLGIVLPLGLIFV